MPLASEKPCINAMLLIIICAIFDIVRFPGSNWGKGARGWLVELLFEPSRESGAIIQSVSFLIEWLSGEWPYE